MTENGGTGQGALAALRGGLLLRAKSLAQGDLLAVLGDGDTIAGTLTVFASHKSIGSPPVDSENTHHGLDLLVSGEVTVLFHPTSIISLCRDALLKCLVDLDVALRHFGEKFP